MSKIFKQAVNEFGINHVVASAYHPQSQGCLERFHQTLKQMLTKFCVEYSRDWDECIQVALYAIRTAKQESLGYSPFELMFGWNPREPLKILYELWEDEECPSTVLEYVATFRSRMSNVYKLVRENLSKAQAKMKKSFDKKVIHRKFQPGDLVLIFLPVKRNPLHAKYQGPYVVKRRVANNNYIVSTPDRRQVTRQVHINLLKEYVGDVEAVGVSGAAAEETPMSDFMPKVDARIDNASQWECLKQGLTHLEEGKRSSLMEVLGSSPRP